MCAFLHESSTDVSQPIVTVNGMVWAEYNVFKSIGGPIPRQKWTVRCLRVEFILEIVDAVRYREYLTPYKYATSDSATYNDYVDF